MAYQCSSTMGHVMSVVVTVGTEVHTSRDPRERFLLATTKTTLQPCLVGSHLYGERESSVKYM